MAKWSIQGATLLTPDKVIEKGGIIIDGAKIAEASSRASHSGISVSVSDAVLLPGLINSHDHLIGTYLPKVGNGPYVNWLPWDNDLKSADVYRERQQVENRDLYLLGGYRNLLSGVTSVSDHIPHAVNEPFLDILPVKALSRYALAHSVGPLALQWGDGISIEYQKAQKEDIPFITHCSEGFDEETKRDVRTLERLGAIGEYTVLIHGIAFSKDDIALLKERRSNVVWCADSNMYMFNETTDIKGIIDAGVNVSIGTDSPMSGGENLLHEMRFGREYYRKKYGEDLPAKQIVRMVTSNPAHSFRLHKNGKIEPGNIADIVLFRRKGDPYESVGKCRFG